MKRIVISSNTSWSIYNFRLNLARSLKKDFYDVILVAPYDKYSEYLKEEFEYYDISINNKGVNPTEDLKVLRDYYKIYKQIKPHMVLNFTIKPNIYGSIVCRLLGIKVINNVSGLGTVFIKEGFTTKIVKLLYKLSLKKAEMVFFQNKDDKELFLTNCLVKYDNCDLLPGSGVDTVRFRPLYLKKDKIFRFLLISRIIWDKGIGEYIAAIRILRKKYPLLKFQLAGPLDSINKTAISKSQVQKWVEEGLVDYIGATDDVEKFIVRADCIVLPSYREGTPRVLLESASMGKPIITTNAPGCKEVVDDGINGFLCKTKNSNDLADKMEKIFCLEDKDRFKMGCEGRKKIISEFDEKIVIEKYSETIKRLIVKEPK